MAALPKPVRARALDPTKALAIYRTDEDKDIVFESSAVPRVMPHIPTGMEKGEEEVWQLTKKRANSYRSTTFKLLFRPSSLPEERTRRLL